MKLYLTAMLQVLFRLASMAHLDQQTLFLVEVLDYLLKHGYSQQQHLPAASQSAPPLQQKQLSLQQVQICTFLR